MKIFKNTLFPAVLVAPKRSVFFAMLIAGAGAHGATIVGTNIGVLTPGTGGTEISFFTGNSYIKADPTTNSGYTAGTTNLTNVIDYHFYESAATAPDLSLAGATHISNPLGTVGTGTVRFNRRSQIDYYTSSDPADSIPDAQLNGLDLNNNGAFAGLTGTVTLAGLDPNFAVDIYFITLTWNTAVNISITPSFEGSAGTTMTNLLTVPVEGNAHSSLSKVTISNFSDVDQIDFELSNTREPGLHGIIVTQVPEPTSSLLVALGALGLTVHRRR